MTEPMRFKNNAKQKQNTYTRDILNMLRYFRISTLLLCIRYCCGISTIFQQCEAWNTSHTHCWFRFSKEKDNNILNDNDVLKIPVLGRYYLNVILFTKIVKIDSEIEMKSKTVQKWKITLIFSLSIDLFIFPSSFRTNIWEHFDIHKYLQCT